MSAEAYGAMAGFEIISGLQQAEMIRRGAEINKEVNDFNAQWAEVDAYNAEIAGYSKEARYGAVADAALGSQKVAFATQNIDIGFGTAKALQEESKMNKFLNTLDIQNQAHEVALGYKNQARNFRLQGNASFAQGELNAGAATAVGVIGGLRTVGGYFVHKANREKGPNSDIVTGAE